MHDLSHGYCYTANKNMSAIAVRIFWAKVVIIASLSPTGFYQRLYSICCSLIIETTIETYQFPLTGNQLISLKVLLNAIFDLFDEIL